MNTISIVRMFFADNFFSRVISYDFEIVFKVSKGYISYFSLHPVHIPFQLRLNFMEF
ncbi:MAG: hypothetical protein ACJA08_000785 [Cyclobacteriaceae bacterium]|jgi:hypothetical protein